MVNIEQTLEDIEFFGENFSQLQDLALCNDEDFDSDCEEDLKSIYYMAKCIVAYFGDEEGLGCFDRDTVKEAIIYDREKILYVANMYLLTEDTEDNDEEDVLSGVDSVVNFLERYFFTDEELEDFYTAFSEDAEEEVEAEFIPFFSVK